jgi:hypothetical protein
MDFKEIRIRHDGKVLIYNIYLKKLFSVFNLYKSYIVFL